LPFKAFGNPCQGESALSDAAKAAANPGRPFLLFFLSIFMPYRYNFIDIVDCIEVLTGAEKKKKLDQGGKDLLPQRGVAAALAGYV
jgi:hypothetical protein